MRSRSNSGVRLDAYVRLVQETILCHQVGLALHTLSVLLQPMLWSQQAHMHNGVTSINPVLHPEVCAVVLLQSLLIIYWTGRMGCGAILKHHF